MKFFFPKDSNGNPIGFKTPESMVYDTSGKSLASKFLEMEDGIILKAPNGTKYKLTVSNDGSITTTKL